MPSQQRSGLSATVGLVVVIGLLLVAGTLAVSGGGILNSGGRLGLNPEPSASTVPHEDGVAASRAPIAPGASPDPGIDSQSGVTGQAFDYTCDAAGIRDATRSKWQLTQFKAGVRDDFERITWELTKRGGKSKQATEVTIEWMDTKAAQEQFNTPRISGQRAIVVTFDGPVDINRDQNIDGLFLEGAGVEMVKVIRMFEGDDGKVRTVIGLRGDGCAKMNAPNFKKNKGNARKAKIFLDIEKPATASE